MTAPAALVGEPPWPDSDGRPIAFLLDVSNRLERDMIMDWLERNRVSGVDVETAALPSSRRHRRHHELSPVLRSTLRRADDPLVAPLRIVWLAEERGGVRRVRLSDLIMTGDPRDPDPIRARWIRKRYPDRVRLIVGAPARLSALRAAWSEQSQVDDFGEFVSHRAWLALERSERTLRGNRYKVPKFISEAVMHRDEVQHRVIEIGRKDGKSGEWSLNRASRYVREIAATHSPLVIDLVANAVHWLYRKTYTAIDYDREELLELYGLGQRASLVFLPSHKSNFDHLILQYLLWENDFPPNHTAGGINMNFFPVGPFLRRSGIFFIRRTFKDNELYKAVLRAYIDYLVEHRFPLEWYIEGGRSRSGKLRAPRYGMLSYVADSFRRGVSDELYLIPTSIGYDQIIDLDSYSAEQRGEGKEAEGAGWLVRTVRRLKLRSGKVHVRFGEPLALAKELSLTSEPDEHTLAIQKLAFEVSRRINEVTPITPTSLVTIALLADEQTALSLNEITDRLVDLNDYTSERRLATTIVDAIDTEAEVESVLKALVEQDIVSVFDGGPDRVWRIQPNQHHAAAYYRNTIVHFFVNGAIAELALVKATEAERGLEEVFWNEVMRLRDLLKFEFFFADKNAFREEIHQELAYTDPDWESHLVAGQESARELLRSLRLYKAHWTLRPFLEAYQVVADLLASTDEPLEEKQVMEKSLALGKQYRLQNRIRAEESVSQTLFETAYKLAANRQLSASEAKPEDLEAFSQEIKDVLRRVAVIDSLATRRHAGH